MISTSKLIHFHVSIKTFILFPFPGSPSPPRDLQITDCYNRKTNLSWSPVVSNDTSVTHYLIDQESNRNASVFKLVYNVSSPNITSVTLNLPGWATLRFRIRAVSSFGPSRPSLPTAEGICTTSVGSKLLVPNCHVIYDVYHYFKYRVRRSFLKTPRIFSERHANVSEHFEKTLGDCSTFPKTTNKIIQPIIDTKSLPNVTSSIF